MFPVRLFARIPGTSWYPTACRNVSVRAFSSSPAPRGLKLPPRPVIDEKDIEEAFLKGSGPGGQKINKTSSAVQLKHLPTGIVVKFQGSRSRDFNRKRARKLLADKLDDLMHGDQSRSALKRANRAKKNASAAKKSKRKYRALEEEKKSVAAEVKRAMEKMDEGDTTEWENLIGQFSRDKKSGNAAEKAEAERR